MISPLSELFPILSAILIHGLGHLTAARLCGLRAFRLHRAPTGLRLVFDRHFPSYDAELYCAFGGPVANAASAILCRLMLYPFGILPAFCSVFIPLSLFLGLLNLLPLQSFDGARILRCFLCSKHRCLPSISPAAADRVLGILSCVSLVLLWLLSVYLLLRRASALCLFAFCFQLFRSTVQKSEHSGVFGSI